MMLNSPSIFSETKTDSWRFAAAVALLLAVLALWVSPEFSVLNLACSLIAGLVSFLPPKPFTESPTEKRTLRSTQGTLGAWVIVVAALWLSPWGVETLESKRVAFAVAAVYFGLVFQGRLALFVSILMVALGLCLPDLAGPGKTTDVALFLKTDSVVSLLASLVASAIIVFSRIAHSRAEVLLKGLQIANRETEASRVRLSVLQENLQLTQERLLGRSLTSGESADHGLPSEGLTQPAGAQVAEKASAVVFSDVIRELRMTLADFQMKGRASGRIAGPIRFVFFAPVAGYDEKSMIAVDLVRLRAGIEACLASALDSLPEIGALKREGVIRLSIRYGLSVIEIAVEDNGRGLTSRKLRTEDELSELKNLVREWDGKFDRLAKLGVGSRTSIELRIVRERARAYRTSLSRDFKSGGAQVEAAPLG